MIEELAACESTHRDRRSARIFTIGSLVWALAFIGASYLIAQDLVAPGWMVGVVACVPILLGIANIFLYRRYLRQTDELKQKIELEALALAYAVGIVGGLGYWLMEQAGLIARAGILEVLVTMMFTYTVGVIWGHRRFA